MISTATAAVNASRRRAPASSQPASVARATTMTIGTKTAETRSASRCTGALPDWASSTSAAIWASAVSAPTRVARTIRRPSAFTVAPVDGVARADLDRQRARRSASSGRRPSGRRRRRRPSRPSPPAGRRTRSPTASASIGISSSRPSRSTRTSRAPSSSSRRIASPERRLAPASSKRPTRTSVVTTAATSK